MFVHKMRKKGAIEGEGITDILMWIIFLILAAAAVYLLVKRLSA